MNQNDDARKFIAGGFADFMLALIEQPQPIVAGGGYSRDKLVAAFNKWAAERNFNVKNGDLQEWRKACKMGKLE
jgi:hypothetical protein